MQNCKLGTGPWVKFMFLSRSCSLYWRCDYLSRYLQAWQRAGTECVKHSHFPSFVSTGPWWPAALLRWGRWLICHRLMPGLLPGHALALIWHCKQCKLHKASTLQDALSWAEQIKEVIMPRGRTQAPGLIWLPTCSELTLVCVKVNNLPANVAWSHTLFKLFWVAHDWPNTSFDVCLINQLKYPSPCLWLPKSYF